MLNNIKRNERGFTIVELLIVIVVIAILAAISIVAYNGIQQRSKTSAAASAAATVQKKAEAANAIASAYPAALADFTAQQDSSLAGSGITLAAITATAPASPSTVEYSKCTTGGTGARIRSYDYTASAQSSYSYLGSSTCTTWGTALSSGGAL
jgi:prepilin-type N-terminal cleavage/methylation domain-containing protein